MPPKPETVIVKRKKNNKTVVKQTQALLYEKPTPHFVTEPLIAPISFAKKTFEDLDDASKEKIIQLQLNGARTSDIMEMFNIEVSAIRRLIKWGNRSQPKAQTVNKRIADAIKKGATISELQNDFPRTTKNRLLDFIEKFTP